jgi:polyphenol oxidase
MNLIQHKGLQYYQFDIFKNQPLFHAVLTRHGGFSQSPYDSLNFGGTVGDDLKDVLRNHQWTYQALGYNFYSRFDVWQVHGTKIVCGDSPRRPGSPHEKADGILTDNPELTLFMRFADCVPILLMDPQKKAIGIVHAGWQGTYKKIAKIAVEKMVFRYGSKPETLLAGIGPSICQDCYEVGSEVLQAFMSSFGDGAKYFIKNHNDQYYLDLWACNRDILKMAGVKRIEIAELCTACHVDDWYSHRAEGGKTGRFGILMAIEDN